MGSLVDAPLGGRWGDMPMESKVISLRARRAKPAAERRANIQFTRVQAAAAPQPVATSDDLVSLTKALIVRLRDGRFNQRAAIYRELDVIARRIERKLGLVPGTWV